MNAWQSTSEAFPVPFNGIPVVRGGTQRDRLRDAPVQDAQSRGTDGVGAVEGTYVRRAVGGRQGWSMCVELCEAPRGYDTSVSPHVGPYHAIEWHLTAAEVHRVLPGGQKLETLGCNGFILRPAGVWVPVVASGPARYAQFRWIDEFARDVAVDWMGDAGDRADLLACQRFMRSDAALTVMLDGYLRRALDEDEPPTRLEMDSRATLIVLQVLKRHSVLAARADRARRGGLAPHQLRKVCDMMTSNLEEEIPLAELAARVGVSYHHFCHAFKASTGMAPHQWRVESRVDRACELLRSTRLSVTEIAAMVGYDDPNQLLRVFRSRRGTTPAAYRREFQARCASSLAM